MSNQHDRGPYQVKRYFYRALDPLHVGAGGYRLGRVDKTIVREPGTNLPKIPGTSISGAARSYAALICGKPEAAGAATPRKGEEDTCPIFRTFGSATDAGGGYAGTVSFGDAQLLFVPIRSLLGCVWITSPDALASAGFDNSPADIVSGQIAVTRELLVATRRVPAVNADPAAGLSAAAGAVPATAESFEELVSEIPGVNLGWLWFEKAAIREWTCPNSVATAAWNGIRKTAANLPIEVRTRAVMVSDRLFSVLVNSNLEVRTSVAISEKGVAATRKLFSYEAIPRGTWLSGEVIQDNYRDLANDGKFSEQFKKQLRDDDRYKYPADWDSPLAVAQSGLNLMSVLGIGGMGTRGFGRLELTGDAGR